ncbi:MAG: FadR family transcriptional regulator [Acidobacteria bacterium]|nr:MAG: FadR family transcriptional regulator [Acidobacteriota bacterium]PYQ18789.1 MAG: FadR family transcriptional regulator [Acidobacteriota bacterium]
MWYSMGLGKRLDMAASALRNDGSQDAAAAEQVMLHVSGLIERGALRPGDRLASERDLASQVGVSRTSVRAGLRSLAAMGVVQTRRGAGTFITAGPPTLVSEPLRLIASLHGLDLGGLWEVRRVLEAGSASLAAERASAEQIATLSDEVTGMYSALHQPQTFLDHDLRFHRAVAAAANNPMLGAIIEAVAALFFEQRRVTIERARNLRESADAHRKIYQAIRARDGESARAAMEEHIRLAQLALATEEGT